MVYCYLEKRSFNADALALLAAGMLRVVAIFGVQRWR
jgi:hypothetical protein